MRDDSDRGARARDRPTITGGKSLNSYCAATNFCAIAPFTNVEHVNAEIRKTVEHACDTAHNAFRRPDGTWPPACAFPGLDRPRSMEMQAFLRRFLMHYGIYRRYPLGRLPALRNAWRTARP
jgi:hypothetical protein